MPQSQHLFPVVLVCTALRKVSQLHGTEGFRRLCLTFYLPGCLKAISACCCKWNPLNNGPAHTGASSGETLSGQVFHPSGRIWSAQRLRVYAFLGHSLATGKHPTSQELTPGGRRTRTIEELEILWGRNSERTRSWRKLQKLFFRLFLFTKIEQ